MGMTIAQFKALKIKADTEWKRRKYNGSMVEYADKSYSKDASLKKLMRAEDGNLIMTPFEKMTIHGDLSTASKKTGIQESFNYNVIDTWLLALSTTEPESETINNCNGACSGLCLGGCSTGCTGTCTGGCTSCTGTCTGTCKGTCSTGCTGCTGTCSGGCNTGCSSCAGAGTCGSSCTSCTSCEGCSGGCNDDGCTSCKGCTGGCNDDGCTSCKGCSGYNSARSLNVSSLK